MAIWQLRRRLAIAVLGVPLALAACDKQPRDDSAAAPGTKRAAPRDRIEPPMMITAPYVANYQTTNAGPGGCSHVATCVPHAQAGRFETQDATGCARLIERDVIAVDGQRFFYPTVSYLGKLTATERAKGKLNACCYGETSQCWVDGRPLRDRNTTLRASPLRGNRWC